MTAPSSPTVTPLPTRRPFDDMLNSPTTRPRRAGGASSWTYACAIEVKPMLSTPPTNSASTASAYTGVMANTRIERAQSEREHHGDADARLPEERERLEAEAAQHRARRVRRQEDAVGDLVLRGAEHGRELRHLRLVGVADEQ